MKKSIFLTVFILLFICCTACSSSKQAATEPAPLKSAETDLSAREQSAHSTTAQNVTTQPAKEKEVEKSSGGDSGIIGGTIGLIGDIIALPFRIVGALIDIIF